ncbi:MAG: DUF4381 family protein [Verrucomicrobia bacterium]|nr:DUF4381 family protein [Verrucomicrobiota bacterium]
MATNQPVSIASATDIRDIVPPIDIPSGLAWLWWLVGTILLLALLIAAWRYWLRRKTQKPIVIEIPAHERARRKLEAALNLFDQPKPFCTIVSDAVRLYLEERFGLRAPERTTDEFLGDLSRSAALTQAQKKSLEQFLSACDMVKFAKYEPQRPELEALYNSALRLIEETEPVKVQSPESRVQSPSPA